MQSGSKYNSPCQNAFDYFSRGNFKKLLEDYIGALEDYNEAIKLKPLFSEAFYQRGNVKTFLNDEKGALSDYDKAIKIILERN